MSNLRPVTLLLAAMMLATACAEDAVEGRVAQAAILPKVPARATIAKQAADEQKAVSEWVQKLIESKEKRAQTELEAYKKQFIAEERRRQMEARDRERRQERLEIGTPVKREVNEPIHISMEFQVPEIAAYRAIADTMVTHQVLASGVVDMLAKLDRDGDGKLNGEEYRDAGALIAATITIFESFDKNADGMISDNEIDGARDLPQTTAEALKSGRASVEGQNFRIKKFDANNDGVLDVDERKALVMAYVDAALHAQQDAAFYRRVADALSTSREPVAAKFADIEITP